MAATPSQQAEQARLALRAIVADHGPEVLSRPRELANLLADLLPDVPRISKILVAAAQDRVAEELCQHTSGGMDATTASRLAASSFADATMFAPEVCAWVVGQFALALGLVPDSAAFPVSVVPPVTAGTATSPDRSTLPPATLPAFLIGGAAVSATREWSAVVTADRAYFDGVIAGGELDAGSIGFPADCPERRFRLSGAEMRIGRRSASRRLEPEVDLTGPPMDPGISHLHAVLLGRPDGTWAVVDRGSANGTQVNGREIDPGVPVPLRDGDRICLGAWTTLTVHSS
jgi:hypothetical protein